MRYPEVSIKFNKIEWSLGEHLISIAVLCGGKSKRFGSKKVFHRIKGKTILQIVFDKFKDYTNDIFLQISNNNDCNKEYNSITTNIQKDLTHEKGPLGGIFSALEQAKYDHVFIVAGDLPYIDQRIFTLLKNDISFNIVVPRWDIGFLEPLCALYSKEVLPILKHQIEQNDLKISNLYHNLEDCDNKKYNIKYLSINQLIAEKKINENCFKNINTLDDLKNISNNLM